MTMTIMTTSADSIISLISITKTCDPLFVANEWIHISLTKKFILRIHINIDYWFLSKKKKKKTISFFWSSEDGKFHDGESFL